jgi:hypothetical protein
MVPDTKEWRTSSAYDFMDEVDTDNLAWECLRRNEGYQKDFSISLAPALADSKQVETIRTRWGLRFPPPTQSHRPGTSHILDA